MIRKLALALLSVALSPAVAASQDPSLDARCAAFYRERSARSRAHPAAGHCEKSVLVRLGPDVDARARRSLLNEVDGFCVRRYSLVEGLEHWAVGVSVERALERLEREDGVLYVGFDRWGEVANEPNDPVFAPQQWNLHNTGGQALGGPGTQVAPVPGADLRAVGGWDVARTSGVRIAVIDSGVATSVPDLAPNIWTNPGEIANNGVDDDGNGFVDDVHGWDFVENDATPQDPLHHGTAVSSILGARGDNGIGMCGVVWECQIVPLRVVDFVLHESALLGAWQYCIDNGIKLSNNSIRCFDSPALSAAVSALHAAGHLLVCASGNQGTDNDASTHYPASYGLDNVIAVTSSTPDDGHFPGANWGATSVDVAAPGVGITVLTPSGATTPASGFGTSYATPHVTGVAALVWELNPGWTPSQVRAHILATARPAPAFAGLTVSGGIASLESALCGILPAPQVTIAAPSGPFTDEDLVAFTASVVDDDVGLETSLAWTSDLQGSLGTGPSISTTLAPGTHEISAEVTDSGGCTGRDHVNVVVYSADPPQYYVAGDAAPGGDGETWATAFSSLHDALATPFHPSGIDVWVKEGTYVPGGARTTTFAMDREARILGGFRGDETRAAQRDPAAHPTVLSGDVSGDDAMGVTTDNVFTVVSIGSGVCGVVLDGFVITGGNADLAVSSVIPVSSGGGVFVAAGAHVELRRCRIVANHAGFVGGAIAALGKVTLSSVLVAGNSAGVESGGVELIGPGSVIVSSTIADNSALGTGGIRCAGAAVVTGAILWGNSPVDLEAPLASVSYSSVGTGMVSGPGNTALDPEFLGGGDYRLLASSPALDAGDPAMTPHGDLDVDGALRVLDGDLDGGLRIDMGAFEHGRVRLAAEVVTVSSGHEFRLDLDGQPGLPAFSIAGTPSSSPVVYAPYGAVWLAPAAGISTSFLGYVPLTLAAPVPVFVGGLDLLIQVVAIADPTHGHLTGPGYVFF